jgi:acetyl-CoA acyltransferase
MRDVYVIGVSTTRFAKFLERSVKSLTAEAVEEVLKDAGLGKERIEAAWFSNSGWGVWSDQHCIRGQVALRPLGISGIPITNVENACASGSTAFHGAWTAVACGLYDVVLAIGAEKAYSEEKAKMFWTFGLGVDMEKREEQFRMMQELGKDFIPPGQSAEKTPVADKEKSAFMDVYGGKARWHMQRYGTTQRQFAVISSKNHYHGSLNPKAQYRKEMSVEEVMADKLISYPVTRAMCSPTGDGAAAAILCSKHFLKKMKDARPIKVLASVLGSGTDKPLGAEGGDAVFLLSKKAYEFAGLGPEDINVAEVHDASAVGELMITESLGFCSYGEGGPLAESGATRLGGKIPVNTSGGLEAKGHPVGATGLSQIHELVTQLRGEAGARQVEGARIALSENGGGFIGHEEAAICVHIFEKVKK